MATNSLTKIFLKSMRFEHFFGFGQNFRKSRSPKPIHAVGWRLEQRCTRGPEEKEKEKKEKEAGLDISLTTPHTKGGEQCNNARRDKRADPGNTEKVEQMICS